MNKDFWDLIDKIPDGNKTRAILADQYVDNNIKQNLEKISDKIYADSNDNICIETDEIYKIIAEESIKILNNYNAKNNKQCKTFVTVPVTLRKIIYFTVYIQYLINFGSVKNREDIQPIYQKATLDGINEKLSNLNSDIRFHKNSFNREKWNISPYLDFVNNIYQPFKMPIYYQGQKNNIYGFMISSLAREVYYDTFADVFAGSGSALMNVYHTRGVTEYLNDLNPANFNFFGVLKQDYDGFQSELKTLIKVIESFSNTARVDITKQLYKYADNTINNKSVNNPVTISYNFSNNNITKAVAFYFVHSFKINGHISASGINEDSIKKFIKESKSNILKGYSERLKHVNILNQDAIQLLLNPDINKSTALCYLDSPYTATKGYSVEFTKKDMEELIDNLSKFKGKFIFSYRASIRLQKSLNQMFEEIFYNSDFNSDFYRYARKEKDVTSKEKEIYEFFSYFYNAFHNKQLFVLYQSPTESDINGSAKKEDIENMIYKNKMFEIMITNFDFKCPDINDFTKRTSTDNMRKKGFCKIEFNKFYNIVNSTFSQMLKKC